MEGMERPGRRFAVIGTTGSGKTTLDRRIIRDTYHVSRIT